MRLNQALSSEKELKKSLKSRTKSLKKSLKKKKKGKSDLSTEKIASAFDKILGDLSEYFQVGAVRTWADTRARADIIIDGEPLVEDVPVDYLILAEKQLKYMRDLVRRVPLEASSKDLDAISARIERLHNAVRFARQDLNARQVEEPPYGKTLVDYILHGKQAGGEATTEETEATEEAETPAAKIATEKPVAKKTKK